MHGQARYNSALLILWCSFFSGELAAFLFANGNPFLFVTSLFTGTLFSWIERFPEFSNLQEIDWFLVQ